MSDKMNLFRGGFGNIFGGDDCSCIWILLLLVLFCCCDFDCFGGCGDDNNFLFIIIIGIVLFCCCDDGFGC